MLRIAALCLIASTGIATADRLGADDLARKKEGGYVTGLPLFAYSVDFGVGLGARAYYYWNGTRDDERFAETPYLHRVFLQAFASTKGLQFHWLDYDGPRLANTPYRPRGQLVLARSTDANYFGTVANAPLAFPGAPGTFASYDDYVAAQERAVAGTAYTKYDQLDVLRPSLIASLERSFLDGHIRVLAGVGFSYTKLHDYSGETVRAVDDTGAATTATEAPTRFREDCDAGRLVGCSGGRDNYVRLGFSYDTRDFEPDPNRGVFLDAELDVGTLALGSEYDYARIMAAARGFWSPIPAYADLVLAGRVFGLVQSEGTPFFSMNIIPFTEDPRFGLGGHRTLRGFRQDRFVDHVMTAASAEIRWTFARTTVKHQKLAFILAPFVDVGRAFDDLGEVTLADWRPSTGAAFRMSWNLATLVTFDYGVSSESAGLYVNFGHMF
ncbi:MAG TPA: DUF5982 domain-containing protein [Kofleriaceae bacterium]|nr:DUF5982 domain-containing protein [Kofleriaceae bacterium]